MNKEEKVFYYNDVTDDFMETKKQHYILPDDYEYLPQSLWFKVKSSVIYFLAKIFARIYCKFFLHVKIVNRKVIKGVKTGYFLYGNHSNPLSDVFTPALVSDRRIYTICSPANFGIPVIGSILPEIGGIPLGKNETQKKKFREAIDTRIKEGKTVVIYPEAHLWPYYTDVREFSNKSFKYPVDLNVPVFAVTTTFQERKNSDKPNITVYVDGPFYPSENKTIEQNRTYLRDKVYKSLKKRVKNNTYKKYKYIPKKEEK